MVPSEGYIDRRFNYDLIRVGIELKLMGVITSLHEELYDNPE